MMESLAAFILRTSASQEPPESSCGHRVYVGDAVEVDLATGSMIVLAPGTILPPTEEYSCGCDLAINDRSLQRALDMVRPAAEHVA